MGRFLLLLALRAQPRCAQSAPETPARHIVSEIITPGPAQSRSFTGMVDAGMSTNLAFLTLGRVASLAVSAGDKMTAGATRGIRSLPCRMWRR